MLFVQILFVMLTAKLLGCTLSARLMASTWSMAFTLGSELFTALVVMTSPLLSSKRCQWPVINVTHQS